jgi:hypothetical protein
MQPLKKAGWSDLRVVGSAGFVHTLIERDLVDEFQLLIDSSEQKSPVVPVPDHLDTVTPHPDRDATSSPTSTHTSKVSRETMLAPHWRRLTGTDVWLIADDGAHNYAVSVPCR